MGLCAKVPPAERPLGAGLPGPRGHLRGEQKSRASMYFPAQLLNSTQAHFTEKSSL